MCVQLLIGLCAECDAHVMLKDAVNDEILEMVIAKGSSNAAIHGLPMWQSVKVKTNSSVTNYNTKYHGIIIQLIPKLNDKNSLNPLWAITNVRQCPQNGADFVIFIFLLHLDKCKVLMLLNANYQLRILHVRQTIINFS